MNESYMGLTLIGWAREVSSGAEKEPILYCIEGVPAGETAIIGYAGLGLDGKKKWYLHWYSSGDQVHTPNIAYDSPGDALKAFAELHPMTRAAS